MEEFLSISLAGMMIKNSVFMVTVPKSYLQINYMLGFLLDVLKSKNYICLLFDLAIKLYGFCFAVNEHPLVFNCGLVGQKD